jgi:hypothetical protein
VNTAASVGLVLRPAIFDRQIPSALDVAAFREVPVRNSRRLRESIRCLTVQKADERSRALLPRAPRAARKQMPAAAPLKQRDERYPAIHSVLVSADEQRKSGMEAERPLPMLCC